MPQPELFYRHAEIRMDADQPKDSNVVRVVASTSTPVVWGRWSEALAHNADSVDRSSARSVLLNHDRNQIIGGIKSTVCDGKQMIAELEIDPSARTNTGLVVLDAIRKGYVRGISIGYQYSESDCTTTKHVRNDAEGDPVIEYEVIVNRWQLREISVTPTPADVNAQVVRSLPKSLERAADPAPAQEESGMPNSNQNTAPAPQGEKSAAVVDVEKVRADEVARAREVVALARTHNLPEPEKYLGMADAEKAMLRDLAALKAQEAQPKGSTVIDVTRDAGDKANEAAVDGLLDIIGCPTEKNGGMRTGSILELGRRYFRAHGHNVDGLNKYDMAALILGKSMVRDAANVTCGMFNTYVLSASLAKQVVKGFMDFESMVTYNRWCGVRYVSDFKSFTGAALDVANLIETPENLPFHELSKGETGYSSALKMWGGTLSLTEQAIINDDLGEFGRALSKAGSLARRTIDKTVYSTLAGLTWTNHKTVADLAKAGLDAVRAAMAAKTGPAGEVLGITPSFLIVPSGLRTTALELTRQVQGATTFNTHTDLEPIVTPFLTTATTASQSTYYLAASPMVFDTMMVAFLQGMTSPIVREYDAGSVAARKWKIYLPFVAFAAAQYGLQQGAHA